MAYFRNGLLAIGLVFFLPALVGIIDAYSYFWFGQTLLRAWDADHGFAAYIMMIGGLALGTPFFVNLVTRDEEP